MSISDYEEGAPGGQPQMPALVPGGLYTRKQVMKNLGVGQKTFEVWIKSGLHGFTDTGAANHFYFADDVLAFIATFKKS